MMNEDMAKACFDAGLNNTLLNILCDIACSSATRIKLQ